MRIPITIVLCSTLVGASVAAAGTVPTITIYTEPPELEIWVDGERMGVGEVVLFGPFDDYVEVTVKGKGYQETTEVVDPPTDDGERVIVIIRGEPSGFNVVSLVEGVGAGFLIAFAGTLAIAGY